MTQHWGYLKAMEDFRHERNIASLQIILGRLTGKPVDLLSFEEVARKLRVSGGSDRGLQDIPIDAIVGSVSRYSDFTRTFLPRHDSDIGRWARVKSAVTDDQFGVPPIEVYKIGDAYFVKDGHHRVSVARHIGAKSIQANVQEIQTRVGITPETRPDDLILKAEYADFLSHTRIDRLFADADLKLTVPGSYERLEDHIQVHRYFMGLDLKRDIPYEEAVVHWYEFVYLPVRQAIEERGILKEFPGRTETDLYLWISDHRYTLEKELGWLIRPDIAASDLANKSSPRIIRILERWARRVLDKITPESMERSPAPGQWRKERTNGGGECLFQHILVPVSGEEIGWKALEQAMEFSDCEETVLQGLHVVPDREDLNRPEVLEIREIFNARCRERGIAGALAITEGSVNREICDWARLSDLVILNVAYPPSEQLLSRVSSGLRTIIVRCPRPILAVPGRTTPMRKLLLAFDASPRAKDALYVSAYFAGKWGVPLTVLSVEESGKSQSKPLRVAREYLEDRGVEAKYKSLQGPVAECILRASQEEDSQLILMGGYGFSSVVELVMGSSVDQVLRSTTIPVLICQ